MDESAYHNARNQLNRLPCVFERVLLARHAVCELATSHQIAERETIACSQATAHQDCKCMLGLLREKSGFALGLADTRCIMPYAMVMKIQCGGLDGLKALLDPQALVPNVRRLLRLARERHGDFDDLPFSVIVQGIAAWKLRQRHPGEPQ